MICGVHAVFEVLARRTQPVERIHILRDAQSAEAEADSRSCPRARSAGPQGRAFRARQDGRRALFIRELLQSRRGILCTAGESCSMRKFRCVVVLDGVEDPHNLGAVIRTAEASGVSGVVVPERHSAPLTATVAKASAGALALCSGRSSWKSASTLDELKKKGVWVVGVDAEGERLWTDFDYTGPVALVFGGEHRGLRRLVREHCDVVVRLPMLGKVGSLNISVAAGVVLYEVVRQRGMTRTVRHHDELNANWFVVPEILSRNCLLKHLLGYARVRVCRCWRSSVGRAADL